MIRPVRCLVLGQQPEPDFDLLRRELPVGAVELVQPEPSADLRGIGDVQIIWRIFPRGEGGDRLAEALKFHPEVRWVHSASAGIDHLAPLFRSRPDTILTHSAGVTAVPISEFVVACLLHFCKRLHSLAELQEQRRFGRLPLRELRDLKVVLLGLGAIGAAVAERLLPFGCAVEAVRRQPGRPHSVAVGRVYGPGELQTACTGADALVLAAPSTGDTRRVVDARVLGRMAAGGVVVNVARGELLDEAALLAGLAAGRPAAAYLDVFSEEPLPATSPLWSATGVHVSPHLSWSSPHLARRSSQLFLAQLRRWLDDQPLANVADPSLGY